MSMEHFDVVVIGAGVVGAAVARELSLYELRVCVLEQEEDVCSGTSKANSGIIHSGYDAAPGTKKAYYNVLGAQMLPELSRQLDFEFEQRGSLLVCFEAERLGELEAVPVCPEILGGLPTPRTPAERQGGRVVAKDGRDVTAQYRRGAVETLRLARQIGRASCRERV